MPVGVVVVVSRGGLHATIASSLRDTCLSSLERLDESMTGNFFTAEINRPAIACACNAVIILLVNSAVRPIKKRHTYTVHTYIHTYIHTYM